MSDSRRTAPLANRVFEDTLTRGGFLWLATAGTATTVPFLGGCAVDPVTGESQVVLMSEGQEVAVDQEQSPHSHGRLQAWGYLK